MINTKLVAIVQGQIHNNIKCIAPELLFSEPEHPSLKTFIEVPDSLFKQAYRHFGEDMGSAFFINVGSTALIELLLSKFFPVGIETQRLILTFAGSMTENIGFYIPNLLRAWNTYRTTPIENRLPIRSYLKDVLIKGSITLMWDTAIHDPLYWISMYLGQIFLPATPAWLIAIASFILALIIITNAQVALKEIKYAMLARSLRKAGFEEEPYYEARFYLPKTSNTPVQEILDTMASKFNLYEKFSGQYHDKYFRPSNEEIAGRNVLVRTRERETAEAVPRKSAQVIFVKSEQMEQKCKSMHNYFVIKKTKFRYILQQNLSLLESLFTSGLNKAGRLILKRTRGNESMNITFNRMMVRDPEKLYFAIDDLNEHFPYYIVELKAWSDLNMLKEAMRFLMIKYPVHITTHPKSSLMDYI
ncbi:MAG: hypothetical protein PHV30_05055 [Candidatus Margulisbacteria bacterium]|nr:hypothetical protein [Candidatus Margulisiibacteriota bacterium]